MDGRTWKWIICTCCEEKNGLVSSASLYSLLLHRPSNTHGRVCLPPGSFLAVAPPPHSSQTSCSKTLTWHCDLNDLPVRRLRFNPLQGNAICRRTCGDSTVHRLCARGRARLPWFTAASDSFKWVVELCFEQKQGSKNVVGDFSSGTAEGCATLISYLALKPFVSLAGADSQTSKRGANKQ